MSRQSPVIQNPHQTRVVLVMVRRLDANLAVHQAKSTLFLVHDLTGYDRHAMNLPAKSGKTVLCFGQKTYRSRSTKDALPGGATIQHFHHGTPGGWVSMWHEHTKLEAGNAVRHWRRELGRRICVTCFMM